MIETLLIVLLVVAIFSVSSKNSPKQAEKKQDCCDWTDYTILNLFSFLIMMGAMLVVLLADHTSTGNTQTAVAFIVLLTSSGLTIIPWGKYTK